MASETTGKGSQCEKIYVLRRATLVDGRGGMKRASDVSSHETLVVF